MLHTKFHGNQSVGYGEDFLSFFFFFFFYNIWAWRPSWSCDPDAVNKISFLLPKEVLHKIWL